MEDRLKLLSQTNLCQGGILVMIIVIVILVDWSLTTSVMLRGRLET